MSLDSDYQKQDLYCLNCNHHHKFHNGVLMCSEICSCNNFESHTSLVLTNHQKALDNIKNVSDKVRYMYEEIGGFENYTNKYFIFAYWHYNEGFAIGSVLDGMKAYHLTDPEVIRRTRQKLIEKNPEWASTDKQLNIGKETKFGAILEFVRD